jgi:hypothetical protein
LASTEQTGDGIHQDAKGRLTQLPAGLAQRPAPLPPAVAFGTGGTMGALPPQHAKAQRPLGAVVGGLDPMLHKAYPQRRPRALQASGQATGLIGAVLVAIEQGTKPRLPRPPLTARGGRCGHRTPALPLRERPRSTGRQCRVAPRRPPAGGAHQMRQTRWAMVHPVVIHAVTSAAQDALPILQQRDKGVLRALGMPQGQRHRVSRHGPQPLPGVVAIPGRCVDVASRGVARQGGNRLLMRPEGVRGPVQHFWHRSQADGQRHARVAEGVHAAPRGPMYTASCAAQRRPARARAADGGAGDRGLAPLPTPDTTGLVQHAMGHVEVERRKLDALLGVRRCGGHPPTLPTGTGSGIHLVHLGGRQQGRARARMARASPTCARGRVPLAFLCARRVRGWRRTGGGGGCAELSRERSELVLQLVHAVLQGEEMLLDRRRGVLPILLRTGKRPVRLVGVGWQ